MPGGERVSGGSGRGGEPPRGTRPQVPGRDRRSFVIVIAVCVLMLALVAFVAGYKLLYDTVEESSDPRLDLSSLYTMGTRAAGPALHGPDNPCIAIQGHLERLRLKRYKEAYEDQANGLRSVTSLDAYVSSARRNAPLFRDIASYGFPECKVAGDGVTVRGFIEYGDGARSKVEASFVREKGRWKIAVLTVVYQ